MIVDKKLKRNFPACQKRYLSSLYIRVNASNSCSWCHLIRAALLLIMLPNQPSDFHRLRSRRVIRNKFCILCTNSAPLVDKVDTGFSFFLHHEGLRDHMTFTFAGRPFAERPTANLRFKNAVALNSTSYVNATKYSPMCLQYGYLDGNYYGLSDCPRTRHLGLVCEDRESHCRSCISQGK